MNSNNNVVQFQKRAEPDTFVQVGTVLGDFLLRAMLAMRRRQEIDATLVTALEEARLGNHYYRVKQGVQEW